MYLIRIKTYNKPDCWWKATAEGDPGRTLIFETATKFGNKTNCKNKIKQLMKRYPNRKFSIDTF